MKVIEEIPGKGHILETVERIYSGYCGTQPPWNELTFKGLVRDSVESHGLLASKQTNSEGPFWPQGSLWKGAGGGLG